MGKRQANNNFIKLGEFTMKKIAVLLTVFSFAFANIGHAQPTGSAVSGGSQTGSEFAWAIGLGALATLGVVIGVTASSAGTSPTTFSHS